MPLHSDYRVYDAAITALWHDESWRPRARPSHVPQRLHVLDHTAPLCGIPETRAEWRRAVQRLIPQLANRFVIATVRAEALENAFRLPSEIVLLPETEHPCLAAFVERHLERNPEGGVVTLSGIAFDDQRSLAAVYIARWCDPRAAMGDLVCLRYVGTRWRSEHVFRLWST
jgi:hypothetical protein